jgi:hypothetical protein
MLKRKKEGKKNMGFSEVPNTAALFDFLHANVCLIVCLTRSKKDYVDFLLVQSLIPRDIISMISFIRFSSLAEIQIAVLFFVFAPKVVSVLLAQKR